MWKFKAGQLPSIALFLTLAAALGAAASPDRGLLSLVPPDAQIVAVELYADRPPARQLLTYHAQQHCRF
jgi:hypothetical protein